MGLAPLIGCMLGYERISSYIGLIFSVVFFSHVLRFKALVRGMFERVCACDCVLCINCIPLLGDNLP